MAPSLEGRRPGRCNTGAVHPWRLAALAPQDDGSGIEAIATRSKDMTLPDRFLLAGVMGWPISQSRSPMLHNYWFAQHGLAGTYVPLAVPPAGLRAALRALPSLLFSGCNLTL